MTDSQAKMISGGLVAVAGAIVFAGGMNKDAFGILILVIGVAMIGFAYRRSSRGGDDGAP